MCARSLSHVHTPFSRCCYLRRSRFSFRPWLSIRCICIYIYVLFEAFVYSSLHSGSVALLFCFHSCAKACSVQFGSVRSFTRTHSLIQCGFCRPQYLDYIPLMYVAEIFSTHFTYVVYARAARVLFGCCVWCFWATNGGCVCNKRHICKMFVGWLASHSDPAIRMNSSRLGSWTWYPFYTVFELGRKDIFDGKTIKTSNSSKSFLLTKKNAGMWLVKELDGVPMYVLMLSWAKGASTCSGTIHFIPRGWWAENFEVATARSIRSLNSVGQIMMKRLVELMSFVSIFWRRFYKLRISCSNYSQ